MPKQKTITKSDRLDDARRAASLLLDSLCDYERYYAEQITNATVLHGIAEIAGRELWYDERNERWVPSAGSKYPWIVPNLIRVMERRR